MQTTVLRVFEEADWLRTWYLSHFKGWRYVSGTGKWNFVCNLSEVRWKIRTFELLSQLIIKSYIVRNYPITFYIIYPIIYVAEGKVHALLGDEKNGFASYISACHKFSKLPSSSKIPGTKLSYHSSFRFKNERNCFNVVSLCRASFGIVIEGLCIHFDL